ncbi:MAG TPA: mercury(II) reductase [Streptosporangiaceae bacterium]|nr:mercury(II) reductase [Streptosporangiaceae bacterium]
MTLETRRVTLEVAGMTCTGCEHHVTAALERAGAGQVSADFRAGVARFALPEGVGEAGLRAAVTAAGYTPRTLRAERTRTPRPGSAMKRTARGEGDAGYDLLVLGAGSAAFAAAIRGRDAGYRVALAEAGALGGTCVNVGCVPSKALLAAGAAYWAAGHPRFAGFATTVGPVDLAALVAQKDDLVAALRQEKYAGLAEAYGFEVLPGRAAFTGPDTVGVAGRVIRPGAALIAIGASPAAPPIPGLAEAGYLTSTTALDLKAVPRRLAVIGANAIGLELGQFFLHLGSDVTFLDVADRIAPFEEPEVSQALTGVLAAQGATVNTGAQIRSVERDGDLRRIRATIDGAETVIDADEILVATGRRPSTAGLSLEAAGVATDARGAVVVDDRLQTTNPRVWAAGDVTGSPQFVYVAAYQGALAAGNALLGEGQEADLTGLPRVIFTSPPAAGAGLTEAQARAAGYQVQTSVLPATAVPRALVNHDTAGVTKLVADAATGALLGASVVGEGAGDVIQSAVLAIRHHITAAELAATFHPYLTTAESLKLAAQAFTRDVARLSCCAA